MQDTLDLAIYKTVHDHPGGAPALAPLINMRAGTLNNKADPAMEGHQFTLRESIPLQMATHTRAIAQAYCQILGGVYLELPSVADFGGDVALLDAWARMQQELGETAASIREALTDGEIDEQEFERISAEFQQDFEAQLQLLNRLRALRKVQGKANAKA